jgi:hypothetical protein
METQPVVYFLERDGDADFWAQAGDATRRTLIMPQPNATEFLAFGVIVPSYEVLFVARGQVLDHLGGFAAHMAKAGASVELYGRVPLLDSVVAPYIDGVPFPQNETDEPPTLPVSVGDATLKTSGGNTTLAFVGNESSLWTMTGSARWVLVTQVPNATSEYLAFGMVDMGASYWNVNFVARVASSGLSNFLSKMPQGTLVDFSPPADMPPRIKQYMTDNFGTGEGLTGSMAVAQLGQAAAGAPRLALG